jgi:alpha-L-rhamnosidase
MFRKEFSVDKKIKQAYVYVTACGFYEFYINGQKVGDHVLDPAITDYRKTVLYSTFDVSGLLQQGANVAGAMLGNGAYNMRNTKGRYSWGRGNSSLGNPCFLAQINVTYNDGSQSIITTDETWKSAYGPVTFNNIYGGEDYNAQKEIDGWHTSGFNDNIWENAAIASNPGGSLKSQLMPPIKVTETIQPVAQTNPTPGVYLYDLGQNIAGWWRINLKGEAGVTLRIRGAETLNDSLFAKPLQEGDVLSTKHRYHSQVWTDYTIKSSETETYEPHFFYSGFRYIEVVTSNKKNLNDIKVEGRVVRSALTRNGTFTSSNSLLNKIHEAGLWSQKGNTVGYPTDCPHREKGAYNGDGQVIAETSMHDFQMVSFYTKWLNDMRDSQEENGRIPNTSPVLVGGMGGGVAWGSAYVLIPWWMNHYYNDERILQEHYPTMKRYLLYLKNLAKTDKNPQEPYIINDFDSYWYSLGEWCAPGQSDGPNHPVVNTFYYYYNTTLMAQFAQKLGNDADAQQFTSLADTIKSAFNDKFFNKETGLYGTEETYQTYQLLALLGDLPPEGYPQKVLNTIIDDIVNKRNGHLNTGIIGTKYLWTMLSKEKLDNLTFDVATQTTYPSYGYWLENNSTTLLEAWSGKNSHNHEMFGTIVEYFYKYLAGIQSPMEGNTSVGYKSIYLEPHVPEKLNSVDASLETVAGKIAASWKKEQNSFEYTVSIPANTTATVILPVFDFENISMTEGSSTIWNENKFVEGVPGIHNMKKESNHFEITIGSGNYTFNLQTN